MPTADLESDIILQKWNSFGFKYVEKLDYPKVLASLQSNFYLDEPIHKVLGVTEERKLDMDEKISDVLDLNHGSFYAYPLDDPSKVAAVLIIWIQENGKSLPTRDARSPLTVTVRKCIMQMKKQYCIHTERGLKKYPELFIISTDKDYRGKGLATEMYRKAIAVMKSKGFPIVSSTFTNPLSRKIGEKLGFKQVSRVDFKDCFHEDGSPIFGEAGREHYAVETVLDLNQ